MINKDLKKENQQLRILDTKFVIFFLQADLASKLWSVWSLCSFSSFSWLQPLRPLAELRLQPRIGCLWPSFLQCVDRLYERRHRRWTERLRTGRNRLLMSRANLVERISRSSPTSAGLYSPHPVINTDRFTSLSPRRPRKARLRRGTLKGPKDAIVQCHCNGKRMIHISAFALNFPASLKPAPV